MQNQDFSRFEFVLKLEENIVIQRFFNVPHYNPIVKKSVDFYDCVKFICEDISLDFKSKKFDYKKKKNYKII